MLTAFIIPISSYSEPFEEFERKPKMFFSVKNAYTNSQCNDLNGIKNIPVERMKIGTLN